MKIFFDHERLNAYQEVLKFAAWSEAVLDKTPRSSAVYGQLDRARTSIVLNLAEGNAKFTAPDRCKFLDISRGSTVECAACLDLLFVKQILSEAEVDAGKELLSKVASMLVGLIKRVIPDRFHEEAAPYGTDGEENQD